MTEPRRAATRDDDAVEVSTPAASEPTRGKRGVTTNRVARFSLVGLALAAVAGLTAGLGLVPTSTSAVEVTDPLAQPTAQSSRDWSASRSEAREPLTSASPTASATPSATASATPKASASATPKATKTKEAEKETTASATPTATKEATKKATPNYSKLADVEDTVYAESSVNVRTGPGVGYDVVETLGVGDDVKRTDWKVDGWRQVKVDGEAGWINASYLTTEEPEVEAEASENTADSDASSTAGYCSKAGDLESNLTSTAANVLRVVCAKFPSVSSFGGYRPGAGSYHGSGQAIDVMISGEAGWEIARWARANAGELGIIEVIYQQQIWTTQRASEGWRGMSDRGSVSANHYDHVHLSIGS